MDFYDHLFRDKKRIFIVGCGGGYDIMSGLPLYFRLKDLGIDVILGNFSFTNPEKYRKTAEKICEHAYRITPEIQEPEISILDEVKMTETEFSKFLDMIGSNREEYIKYHDKTDYFPELRIATHPHVNDNVILLEISDSVPRVRETYSQLCQKLGFDTVVLIDGGTDSIMLGDEKELGTPYEDMMHICGLWSCPINVDSFLLVLGYGLELGIDCDDIERNIKIIQEKGGFHGSHALSMNHDEVKKFREVLELSNPRHSIICAGVRAALDGRFGELHDYSVEHRIKNNRPIIREETCSYYMFDLNTVAESVIYMKDLINAEDDEILDIINTANTASSLETAEHD